MSAPYYFRDRVNKLQELARADASLNKIIKSNVFVFPNRNGAFVRPQDIPCLVIVPEKERHTPYSSRTGLHTVVTLQAWQFMDPTRPEDDVKSFMGLVAVTTKFLWGKNQVQGFWWAINPESDPWLDWSYATLVEDVEAGRVAARAEAEVRLVEGKINLAA